MNLWKVQFTRAGTNGDLPSDFIQMQFNAVNLDGALIRADEIQPAGFFLNALWRAS